MRRIEGADPNPSGVCQCGCGGQVGTSKQGDRKRGLVRGGHFRFLPGHNQRRPEGAHKGKYRTLRRVGHPRADKNGTVYEHVVVVEDAIGRFLPAGAEVHHVDGNGHNNAHRNLVVCQDKAYHKLLHVRQAVKAAGGDPNSERLCGSCKRLLPFSEFYRRSASKSDGYGRRCKACAREAA